MVGRISISISISILILMLLGIFHGQVDGCRSLSREFPLGGNTSGTCDDYFIGGYTRDDQFAVECGECRLDGASLRWR